MAASAYTSQVDSTGSLTDEDSAYGTESQYSGESRPLSQADSQSDDDSLSSKSSTRGQNPTADTVEMVTRGSHHHQDEDEHEDHEKDVTLKVNRKKGTVSAGVKDKTRFVKHKEASEGEDVVSEGVTISTEEQNIGGMPIQIDSATHFTTSEVTDDSQTEDTTFSETSCETVTPDSKVKVTEQEVSSEGHSEAGNTKTRQEDTDIVAYTKEGSLGRASVKSDRTDSTGRSHDDNFKENISKEERDGKLTKMDVEKQYHANTSDRTLHHANELCVDDIGAVTITDNLDFAEKTSREKIQDKSTNEITDDGKLCQKDSRKKGKENLKVHDQSSERMEVDPDGKSQSSHKVSASDVSKSQDFVASSTEQVIDPSGLVTKSSQNEKQIQACSENKTQSESKMSTLSPGGTHHTARSHSQQSGSFHQKQQHNASSVSTQSSSEGVSHGMDGVKQGIMKKPIMSQPHETPSGGKRQHIVGTGTSPKLKKVHFDTSVSVCDLGTDTRTSRELVDTTTAPIPTGAAPIVSLQELDDIDADMRSDSTSGASQLGVNIGKKMELIKQKFKPISEKSGGLSSMEGKGSSSIATGSKTKEGITLNPTQNNSQRLPMIPKAHPLTESGETKQFTGIKPQDLPKMPLKQHEKQKQIVMSNAPGSLGKSLLNKQLVGSQRADVSLASSTNSVQPPGEKQVNESKPVLPPGEEQGAKPCSMLPSRESKVNDSQPVVPPEDIEKLTARQRFFLEPLGGNSTGSSSKGCVQSAPPPLGVTSFPVKTLTNTTPCGPISSHYSRSNEPLTNTSASQRQTQNLGQGRITTQTLGNLDKKHSILTGRDDKCSGDDTALDKQAVVESVYTKERVRGQCRDGVQARQGSGSGSGAPSHGVSVTSNSQVQSVSTSTHTVRQDRGLGSEAVVKTVSPFSGWHQNKAKLTSVDTGGHCKDTREAKGQLITKHNGNKTINNHCESNQQNAGVKFSAAAGELVKSQQNASHVLNDNVCAVEKSGLSDHGVVTSTIKNTLSINPGEGFKCEDRKTDNKVNVSDRGLTKPDILVLYLDSDEKPRSTGVLNPASPHPTGDRVTKMEQKQGEEAECEKQIDDVFGDFSPEGVDGNGESEPLQSGFSERGESIATSTVTPSTGDEIIRDRDAEKQAEYESSIGRNESDRSKQVHDVETTIKTPEIDNVGGEGLDSDRQKQSRQAGSSGVIVNEGDAPLACEDDYAEDYSESGSLATGRSSPEEESNMADSDSGTKVVDSNFSQADAVTMEKQGEVGDIACASGVDESEFDLEDMETQWDSFADTDFTEDSDRTFVMNTDIDEEDVLDSYLGQGVGAAAPAASALPPAAPRSKVLFGRRPETYVCIKPPEDGASSIKPSAELPKDTKPSPGEDSDIKPHVTKPSPERVVKPSLDGTSMADKLRMISQSSVLSGKVTRTALLPQKLKCDVVSVPEETKDNNKEDTMESDTTESTSQSESSSSEDTPVQDTPVDDSNEKEDIVPMDTERVSVSMETAQVIPKDISNDNKPDQSTEFHTLDKPSDLRAPDINEKKLSESLSDGEILVTKEAGYLDSDDDVVMSTLERKRKRARSEEKTSASDGIRAAEKHLSQLDVDEAVKKLRQSRAESLQARPHSYHSLHPNSRRRYDWNTHHFFPDIHDLGLFFTRRRSHDSIFNQYIEEDWLRDLELEEANMKDVTMETQVSLDAEADRSSSGSGDESPKVWRKNPLLVRRKKRSERTLSTEINADVLSDNTDGDLDTSGSRAGYDSPRLRRKEESPRVRRSPRRWSNPNQNQRKGNSTPQRQNSDLIQDKLDKFQELQRRRKALESNSDERLPSTPQGVVLRHRNSDLGDSTKVTYWRDLHGRTRSQEDIRYESQSRVPNQIQTDSSHRPNQVPNQPSPRIYKPGDQVPPHGTKSQYDFHSFETNPDRSIRSEFYQTGALDNKEPVAYKTISSSFENIYDTVDMSMYLPTDDSVDVGQYMRQARILQQLRRKQAQNQGQRPSDVPVHVTIDGKIIPGHRPQEHSESPNSKTGLSRLQIHPAQNVDQSANGSQPNTPTSPVWYVPKPQNQYDKEEIPDPKQKKIMDAKALIEEESKKFQDYKREYARRLSERDSTDGTSGDEKRKDSDTKNRVIPPDDYEYILRKIHHKRQDAYYAESTSTYGNPLEQGSEAEQIKRDIAVKRPDDIPTSKPPSTVASFLDSLNLPGIQHERSISQLSTESSRELEQYFAAGPQKVQLSSEKQYTKPEKPLSKTDPVTQQRYQQVSSQQYQLPGERRHISGIEINNQRPTEPNRAAPAPPSRTTKPETEQPAQDLTEEEEWLSVQEKRKMFEQMNASQTETSIELSQKPRDSPRVSQEVAITEKPPVPQREEFKPKEPSDWSYNTVYQPDDDTLTLQHPIESWSPSYGVQQDHKIQEGRSPQTRTENKPSEPVQRPPAQEPAEKYGLVLRLTPKGPAFSSPSISQENLDHCSPVVRHDSPNRPRDVERSSPVVRREVPGRSEHPNHHQRAVSSSYPYSEKQQWDHMTQSYHGDMRSNEFGEQPFRNGYQDGYPRDWYPQRQPERDWNPTWDSPRDWNTPRDSPRDRHHQLDSPRSRQSPRDSPRDWRSQEDFQRLKDGPQYNEKHAVPFRGHHLGRDRLGPSKTPPPPQEPQQPNNQWYPDPYPHHRQPQYDHHQRPQKSQDNDYYYNYSPRSRDDSNIPSNYKPQHYPASQSQPQRYYSPPTWQDSRQQDPSPRPQESIPGSYILPNEPPRQVPYQQGPSHHEPGVPSPMEQRGHPQQRPLYSPPRDPRSNQTYAHMKPDNQPYVPDKEPSVKSWSTRINEVESMKPPSQYTKPVELLSEQELARSFAVVALTDKTKGQDTSYKSYDDKVKEYCEQQHHAQPEWTQIQLPLEKVSNQSTASSQYEEHVKRSQAKHRAETQVSVESNVSSTREPRSEYVDPTFIRQRKSSSDSNQSGLHGGSRTGLNRTPSDSRRSYGLQIQVEKAEPKATSEVCIKLSQSKENLADNVEEKPNVSLAEIKQKLFGDAKSDELVYKDELEKVLKSMDKKVSSIQTDVFASKDQSLPIYRSFSSSTGGLKDEVDDERLLNYVSYKDGQARKRSNIYDILTDLERTYEQLDLDSDELLGKAERQEYVSHVIQNQHPSTIDQGDTRKDRNPTESNIKRLSITNLKMLEDQQKKEDNPSLEYAKWWLEHDKSRDPTETASLDRYVLPSGIKPPPSESENSQSRLGSRSSLPRKVKDDMAYRRRNPGTGSVSREDLPASTTMSYLAKSPTVSPSQSMESLARRGGRSKTPDPVFDDMHYRHLQRAKSPGSVDVDPTILSTKSPTSTDYILERTTEPLRGRMRIRPEKKPDKYHDDLAYRQLRRDVPPVVAELPKAYYEMRGGQLKTRSQSLERVSHDRQSREQKRTSQPLQRSQSLGPRPKLERKSSLSKGVATMVSYFTQPLSHTQSAPDLTENVFGDNYNTQGDLVSDDPKYVKHAQKAKKQQTPRTVKMRHELKSKMRQLKHSADSGYMEQSDSSSGPDSHVNNGSPPDGNFDSDDHELRLSDTSSDKEVGKDVNRYRAQYGLTAPHMAGKQLKTDSPIKFIDEGDDVNTNNNNRNVSKLDARLPGKLPAHTFVIKLPEPQELQKQKLLLKKQPQDLRSTERHQQKPSSQQLIESPKPQAPQRYIPTFTAPGGHKPIVQTSDQTMELRSTDNQQTHNKPDPPSRVSSLMQPAPPARVSSLVHGPLAIEAQQAPRLPYRDLEGATRQTRGLLTREARKSWPGPITSDPANKPEITQPATIETCPAWLQHPTQYRRSWHQPKADDQNVKVEFAFKASNESQFERDVRTGPIPAGVQPGKQESIADHPGQPTQKDGLKSASSQQQRRLVEQEVARHAATTHSQLHHQPEEQKPSTFYKAPADSKKTVSANYDIKPRMSQQIKPTQARYDLPVIHSKSLSQPALSRDSPTTEEAPSYTIVQVNRKTSAGSAATKALESQAVTQNIPQAFVKAQPVPEPKRTEVKQSPMPAKASYTPSIVSKSPEAAVELAPKSPKSQRIQMRDVKHVIQKGDAAPLVKRTTEIQVVTSSRGPSPGVQDSPKLTENEHRPIESQHRPTRSMPDVVHVPSEDVKVSASSKSTTSTISQQKPVTSFKLTEAQRPQQERSENKIQTSQTTTKQVSEQKDRRSVTYTKTGMSSQQQTKITKMSVPIKTASHGLQTSPQGPQSSFERSPLSLLDRARLMSPTDRRFLSPTPRRGDVSELSDGEMTDATDITLDGLVRSNLARPSSPETLDFSDFFENVSDSDFSIADYTHSERKRQALVRPHGQQVLMSTSQSSQKTEKLDNGAVLRRTVTHSSESSRETKKVMSASLTETKKPSSEELAQEEEPTLSFKDLIKTFEKKTNPFRFGQEPQRSASTEEIPQKPDQVETRENTELRRDLKQMSGSDPNLFRGQGQRDSGGKGPKWRRV